MAVVEISLAECINCGWCRRVCPTETIKYFTTGHRTHIVEPDGCIDCGICVPVCPVKCIHPVPGYTVAPEKLAAAKSNARAFAANQRKLRLDRDAVVQRTLARLADLTPSPAATLRPASPLHARGEGEIEGAHA